MKIFNKVSVIAFIFVCILGLAEPIATFAATTPSLGAAANYGVLGSTYTNTIAGTTISGNVGFTTGPAVAPLGTHNYYGSGAPYAAAGADQASALSALASQPCTFTFGGGAIDLSTDLTHGPIGVYTPGVYCSSGAMDIGGPLTLNGSGTYIFRPVGALTSTAGAIVTLAGASACNVFWTPTQATTLAANTTFVGTVIDDAGITVGANTTWSGRALAFGETVTTDKNTITVPAACSTLSVDSPSSSNNNTITLFKQVINDNGGKAAYSDFPLFINRNSVISGQSVGLAPGIYTVTETNLPNYKTTFAGDCDANGQINHGGIGTHNDVCAVINDDIGAPVVVPPVPPLIDVIKVPSPLALPAGPGLVTYTYTLRNIGTVPVTNITMVGDTCSPIILVSGDTNADAKLDVNETWIYRCSKTLLETHTNTVVATGLANGFSATDVASATVIVGASAVPPLIHVTKIPNLLTLSATGGMVTYTKRVTNPGTIALSNVRLIDDVCNPVTYISGDTNSDSKLDTTETWIYTCQMNLTKTTINTVIAEGTANGLTARDFAVATVVVASVPMLPNTGIVPGGMNTLWNAIILSIFFILALILFIAVLRKRAI